MPLDDATVLQEAAARLQSAAGRLTAAGARDELLAEYADPRPILGIARAARMRVLGRVWRLGVLLLAADGTVHATGETLRVVDPGQRSAPTHIAEVRRVIRQAALKAGIAEGETIDFDAPAIRLDAAQLRASRGPLVLTDDGLRVRWSSSASLMPFASYLDERVELLISPPQGA